MVDNSSSFNTNYPPAQYHLGIIINYGQLVQTCRKTCRKRRSIFEEDKSMVLLFHVFKQCIFLK